MVDFPTLVFVPGAWHKPACYDKVVKLLHNKYQLKCVPVTLPSTTGDPAATFKDDMDATCKVIASEASSGRDVVVIAHSYGGMVANSAIKGFANSPDPTSSSAAPTSISTTQIPTSTTGHVIGLILIASGYTLTGLAFMDPFFGHPPPTWRANAATGFAELVTPPTELFYHDLPAEEAEYWASQLTPQSLKALFEGGEYSYAGWLDVPSWYIGTVDDQGLPVLAQRMGVGMARAMGASVEHRELRTSHSPFLSRPEETVGLVVEAVQAFTGKSVGSEVQTRERDDTNAMPEVRLFQPLSWYRFGLPLGFGHVLGKAILAFGWVRRLWRYK